MLTIYYLVVSINILVKKLRIITVKLLSTIFNYNNWGDSMKIKVNRVFWENSFFWFVFITLVATAIYSFIKALLVPSGAISENPFDKVRSDYILMSIQCILGLLVLMLPSIIERKWKIFIPSYMHIVYIVFLYAAIYLGEIRSFYYKIPHWDSILHTSSGFLLGALGFSIVSLLNYNEKINISLSPFFVVIFAFCFSAALGVLWEIYEFTIDGILDINMQKYTLETGTNLVGREALLDTMEDLIVDTIGAFIMSVLGYISLKYNKGWIENILIKKICND